MSILAGNHRFLRLFLRLYAQFIRRRITEIVKCRIARITVIERRSCGVEFTHLVVHRLNVRTHSALVAQTPEDDARVVEVALHERLGAVNMSIAPLGVVSHLLVGVAVSVTLLVGLVHNVDAPAVAEFVDILAVGIVRGAQEVDVRLLHQAYVLFVCSVVHITPRNRMVVVTVHTAQFHILSVYLEHLAHTFHALHAEVVVELLDGVVIIVIQAHTEGIEIRLLCRPQPRIIQCIFEGIVDGVTGINLQFRHIGYCLVYNHIGTDSRLLLAGVAYRDHSLHFRLRVVGVRYSRNVIVADMHQRAHP